MITRICATLRNGCISTIITPDIPQNVIAIRWETGFILFKRVQATLFKGLIVTKPLYSVRCCMES